MSMFKTLSAFSAGLAGVALGISVLNVVTWKRGRPTPPMLPQDELSVLIPARDEAREIATCVHAICTSEHAPGEVIVCDDGSTDGTGDILKRLQTVHHTLQVIQGKALPEGWVGKPHACAQLAHAATGRVLCFIDADTKITAQGLSRLLNIMEDLGADAVSAVPRQRTGSWFERMILPLLHLTYTSWLPMFLIHKTRNPAFLAANGQVFLIKREALERVGGFESIGHELVDDMALARRIKTAGMRFVFADGHHIAQCRMYQRSGDVWEGFSKNLYEGIGHHPLALMGVGGVYAGAFLLPYGLVAWGVATKQDDMRLALGALGANITLRAMLAWRFAQPLEGIALHPLGVLGLGAIALNSARVYYKGQQTWRGRVYAPKHKRIRSAT